MCRPVSPPRRLLVVVCRLVVMHLLVVVCRPVVGYLLVVVCRPVVMYRHLR